MPKQPVVKPVVWLSEEITDKPTLSNSFHYYQKFQFEDIVAAVGDYVLISNADAAEPDIEEGCDAGQILELYEDTSNKNDPFRAKVQWYTKPDHLPSWSSNKMEHVKFLEREVIQDHRPFDTDVSIETFYKKCSVTLTFTKDLDVNLDNPYSYVCRYRLMALTKRKVNIEPVMIEERNALKLLCTPNKSISTPNHLLKTPTSLVKKMSRVSLQDDKNWSITKNDGTKILLKRAILADKTEKNSPKKSLKSTPKSLPTIPETPKSSKKLYKGNLEEMLTMELKENSDEELPTLIIRQHTPTPKPFLANMENSRKVLFGDTEKETVLTRSGRVVKSRVVYTDEDSSPVKLTRRASRAAKSSINYMEQDLSPLKRTPRKAQRKLNDSDIDDEFIPAPKTPRTPRSTRTPKTTPSKTPKLNIISTPKRNVTRKIMGDLTPSLHSRTHSVDNIESYIKDNKSLPGRESQMEEILSFVRNKLIDGTSGCMYISGVPGTGKTATVCSSLKILKEDEDLPDFQLVEINGMKIAEPRQAYVQIYKQLTGKTVVWEQACSLLEKRFTNPGPRRIPTVLLVDELDALCNRRQDVIYSLVEWAAGPGARLAVLAVANTMDLPERALASRVASRLGLTRLAFPPYTHTQLQNIVASRLAGANVTPDAVQLIARKVAAVSGDARRALALCSRALELAGDERAGLQEVQKALAEAASGAAVRAIRTCSAAERLMLRAVAAEAERTGTDETTLSRALSTAAAIVALDGRPYKSAAIRPPTPSQAQAICARLASLKLLLLEPKPSEPRLLLNVSADDVHYATRQITV